MVIREFPEPDDMTPWEDIAEFRADLDARDRLRGFRRWLQKVSKEGLSGPEAVEEMRDLLSAYDRHLRVHKMKTNLGVLETLIERCRGC
jgi:predicted TIM-barrel fold metal-dependent hydrolase